MNTALDQQSSKPHPTQVALLLKALELVKVGGRVVFSTCSLNPIENEAVVAEILRRSSGCLELVDVSNSLPGLKRRHPRSCLSSLATWECRFRLPRR